LFPVNFLKCVVTEVVLFSIVAFNTLTFHSRSDSQLPAWRQSNTGQ